MTKLKNAKEMNELEEIGIKIHKDMEKINAKTINPPML
jgi:hypothetical protein